MTQLEWQKLCRDAKNRRQYYQLMWSVKRVNYMLKNSEMKNVYRTIQDFIECCPYSSMLMWFEGFFSRQYDKSHY